MLEIIGLNKDYIQNKTRIFILKNINITFPNKGLVFILGKSGSGKTTFLNLLGGLDFPTSGEIYFNNTLLISQSHWQHRIILCVIVFYGHESPLGHAALSPAINPQTR